MSGYVIYMWEPCLSPHKLGLYRALAAHPRVERIVYIAEEGLPDDRRAQGWSVELDPRDEVILAPDADRVRQIVESSPPSSIHIFAGMRRVPSIVLGLREARRSGRRFGLMSEPRVFEGVAGWARLIQSWLTEGALRRKADFVLAIGRNGPRWFRMAGYTRATVFPYAYFLEEPKPSEAAPDEGVLTLGFLGRLERAKGLHILLDALPMTKRAARLRVAGSGSLRPEVEAAQAGGDLVRYVGVLALSSVPAFLGQIDVLVLASITRDDGWGAVVSEALLSGAAVIVSNRVGASVCIEEERVLGRVVTDLKPASVAAAIDDLAEHDLMTITARERRRQWASAHLTDRAGATQLVEILDHRFSGSPRPTDFYQKLAGQAFFSN